MVVIGSVCLYYSEYEYREIIRVWCDSVNLWWRSRLHGLISSFYPADSKGKWGVARKQHSGVGRGQALSRFVSLLGWSSVHAADGECRLRYGHVLKITEDISVQAADLQLAASCRNETAVLWKRISIYDWLGLSCLNRIDHCQLDMPAKLLTK